MVMLVIVKDELDAVGVRHRRGEKTSGLAQTRHTVPILTRCRRTENARRKKMSGQEIARVIPTAIAGETETGVMRTVQNRYINEKMATELIATINGCRAEVAAGPEAGVRAGGTRNMIKNARS